MTSNPVGASARRTRAVTRRDIELFTAISGDRNPVHYDEDLAARSVLDGGRHRPARDPRDLGGAVRNGYEQIKVTFRIEGDADEATLRDIVDQSRRRSAVYDALTNPTPVHIDVVTT